MGQGVAGNGYFPRLFVCLFVCLFICLFAISPFGKQLAHVYNILYTHSKVVHRTRIALILLRQAEYNKPNETSYIVYNCTPSATVREIRFILFYYHNIFLIRIHHVNNIL